MYAHRDPSGEIARRVTYEAPGAIDSVESNVRSYRKTSLTVAGRIQPQIAVARSSAMTAPTPYVTGLSHVLQPPGVAIDRVDAMRAGLFNASANSCADANRSAGVFSSARETAIATWAGTCRLTVASGRGSSVISRATTARVVPPVNGGSPDSISYVTAPSE